MIEQETKKCSKCGEVKSILEYRWKGYGKIESFCNVCHNKKKTERDNRNRVYSESYKQRMKDQETQTRTCHVCKETKPMEQYKRGEGNLCKQCSAKRDHKREDIRSLKNKLLINEIKKQGCIICGYNKCMSALDWHHINPSNKHKDISSSMITRRSMSRVLDEIAKCVLLCANCHRELHSDPQQGDVAKTLSSLLGIDININKSSDVPPGSGPGRAYAVPRVGACIPNFSF
jgi:hypothetical protein